MNCRFFIAQVLSKAAYRLMRLVGKRGSYFVGVVATKICPDYLRYLKFKGKVIAVTGTNGKTTTSNLLHDFFAHEGLSCANNGYGSNVEAGVASTFVPTSRLNGVVEEAYVVLEVDERSSIHTFKRLKPDYLLVTNLFRDSYERNAHPEFIAMILEQSIPDETFLILNADDLISSGLKPKNPRRYFSLEKEPKEAVRSLSRVVDQVICPHCDATLQAVSVHYHHIGRFSCPNCGIVSPEADYKGVYNSETKQFRLEEGSSVTPYPCISENLANLYNELAALATLRVLGFEPERLQQAFGQLEVVSTRYEEEEIAGKKVVVTLAKGVNPIASSRVLDYIQSRVDERIAVVLVNTETDGHTAGPQYDDLKSAYTENPAWMYDVDFEYLCHPHIKQVIVGGKRFLDYKARLLMAGLTEAQLRCFRNPLDCAKGLDLSEVDAVYILHQVYNRYYAEELRAQIRKELER